MALFDTPPAIIQLARFAEPPSGGEITKAGISKPKKRLVQSGLNGISVPPFVSGVPAVLSYVTNGSDGTTKTNTPYSFSDAALTTALNLGGLFIVNVHGTRTNGNDLQTNSVVVAGVPATLAVAIQDLTLTNRCLSAIWYAWVPAGSSGSVVVNPVTYHGCGVGVFRATNVLNNAPVISYSAGDTAGSGADVSVNVAIPANGFAIACFSHLNGGTPSTFTGATEVYDVNSDSTLQSAGAYHQPPNGVTGHSISTTVASGRENLAVAVWR